MRGAPAHDVTGLPVTPAYASPVDAAAHGEYRPRSARWWSDHLDADTANVVTPGRYHVYGADFDPRSQVVAIVRSLLDLESTVTFSLVDRMRDGRGWAFREASGFDPVNNFTLLREAYERTDPDYDGEVSIPLVWDRVTQRIVSNDVDVMVRDLVTAFAPLGNGRELYPTALRHRIDWVCSHVRIVNAAVVRAVYRDAESHEVSKYLRQFDVRLRHSEFIFGSTLTLADVWLWVSLVRYDVGPNANGAAGPRLSTFPHLWAYARELYGIAAFGDTTDFSSFSAPLTGRPDWTGPVARPALSRVATLSPPWRRERPRPSPFRTLDLPPSDDAVK